VKRVPVVVAIVTTAFLGLSAVAVADEMFKTVKAGEFDPGHTFLVQGTWLSGIGCPTDATIAIPNASFTGVGSFGTYTDPACGASAGGGDSKDKHNEGLLLAKTGPTTTNFASAVAELKNVKGMALTELGYDIRKPGSDGASGSRGSHCGAGAPRFNVFTTDGLFGVGCTSPAADTQIPGDGFIRLRWGAAGMVMGFKDFTTLMPITGTVQRIEIVFDEGYDTGPDNFGLAVLDNIDVNGTLVGRGPHGD
jgi:hypothetical protein